MPDCFLILLAVLLVILINAMAWLIRDIKQTQKENEEINHWLNQGEASGAVLPHDRIIGDNNE